MQALVPTPYATFPAAFKATTPTNSAGSVATSYPIPLGGRVGSVYPVSVAGEGLPQLRINTGSWVTSGLAIAGDTITLRLTTAATPGATTTCFLRIRTQAIPYSVTTTAAWTPLALASILRWFRADNIVGADGDPIGTWPDESGQGHDATASGGDRGVLKTNIQNGLSILRWTAGTNGYRLPDAGVDLASNNTHSWFYACSGTLSNYSIILTYPYGAGWSYIQEYNTDGAFYHGAGGAYRLHTSALSNLTWYVLSLLKTGASTAKFFKTGSEITAGSGTIGSTAAMTGDMQLAGYNANTYGFIGDFGEAICLSNQDDDEARKVEGYLAWKWGLQANLPGGHPYVAGPP